jgi:hypothetical protein
VGSRKKSFRFPHDQRIALAHAGLEAFAVDDGNHASRILDDSRSLQRIGHHADPFAAHAEHVRDRLLRHPDAAVCASVHAHEHPAAPLLLDGVMTVAYGRLRELRQQALHVAHHHLAQMRVGLQDFLEDTLFDAEGLAIWTKARVRAFGAGIAISIIDRSCRPVSARAPRQRTLNRALSCCAAVDVIYARFSAFLWSARSLLDLLASTRAQRGNRMKRVAKLLAAIIVASLSSYASASCRCACVNEQIEPVCSASTDLPPVCAPRACSIKEAEASATPVNQSRAEPRASTQCHMDLVVNAQVGRYEWKKVCQ